MLDNYAAKFPMAAEKFREASKDAKGRKIAGSTEKTKKHKGARVVESLRLRENRNKVLAMQIAGAALAAKRAKVVEAIRIAKAKQAAEDEAAQASENVQSSEAVQASGAAKAKGKARR
jgi:hypothetical protein